MKISRIVSLLLVLVIMSTLFAGCDGGADITLPPEESADTTEGGAEKNVFTFVYNNTEVTPQTQDGRVA